MHHCVPHEISLPMAMIPFQYENMVIHFKTFKVKNEPTFPFVDTLLQVITSYHFDCKLSSLIRTLFLTSKFTSIPNMILKLWSIILFHI